MKLLSPCCPFYSFLSQNKIVRCSGSVAQKFEALILENFNTNLTILGSKPRPVKIATYDFFKSNILKMKLTTS